MGDRYILTVICPKCGHKDEDVYYAPTCGFKTWNCLCGYLVDLEKYSGISEAECSNAGLIEEIIKATEAKLASKKKRI